MAQFDDLVDDEDKFGGTGGELKAFVAGAARAATFGFSDQALTRSGLAKPETLKGLQETDPAASFGGELAGIAGPALFGDEAGLANIPGAVSRLGHAAEGAAGALGAGTITAKALGYGAEGAAYGAGQSLSENALGDHDLVSEKTLANIGLSSALMGGLGSIIGARELGRAADASSAADKFAVAKAERMAAPGSEESVLAQTDLPAEDKLSFIKNFKKQKFGADDMREEFKQAGLPEVLGMMSDNKTIQKMSSAIAQLPTPVGDEIRKTVDQGFSTVDYIIKDAFGVGGESLDREAGGAAIKDQIRGKFDELSAPLKDLYSKREALGKTLAAPEDEALNAYEDLLQQSKKFREPTNEGRGIIAKEADNFLENVSEKEAVANLDAYSKTLSSKAHQSMRLGNYDASAAYYQVRDTVDKFINERLDQLESQLNKEFKSDAGEEIKSALSEIKTIRSKYANLKSVLGDFAETTGLGKRATTGRGLNEILEKIPNEKFVDKIFDPKNAAGLNQIKEQFPEVFQALVKQKKSQIYQNALSKKNFNPLSLISDINNEQKMSKGVKNLLFNPDQIEKMNTAQKWIKNLPEKLGPSGTPEGIQYMEAVKNPIRHFASSAVSEVGGRFSKKMIESLTTPEEAERLRTLINVDKAQEKVNKSIDSGVKSVFENKSNLSRPIAGKLISKISSLEDYDKKTNEITENANNPAKMEELVASSTKNLYNHAPNISTAMQLSFVRGTQFLASKIPPKTIGMFGEKTEASATDMAKFSRYYNIVHDPVSALVQVRDGTIVPETIETLGVVFPKLYEDMKQKMVNQMSKLKDRSSIPFQTRMSMSQFMGEPLTASLMPQNIATNQAAFMVAPQQPNQTKPSKAGMQKMTIADRTGMNHGDKES